MIESKTRNVICSYYEKHRVIIAVVIILLTSVFLFLSADKGFQVDSETLVVDPILMDYKAIKADFGAFGLGCIDDDDEEYPIPLYTEFLKPGSDMNEYFHCYRKYTSQIGLQGYIFRGIAHIVRTTAVIGVLRFLCCLLLVTVLYFIAAGLKWRYGFHFAVAFWIVALISPFFKNFAPNLYWVAFTWFLPMLLGILTLRFQEKRALMYLFFFLTILIKCMCGYEFISTIMMSGIVFQTVEWITGRDSRMGKFKCVLLSGISMLMGFVSAAAIHVFILSNEFYKGDLKQGLHFFIFDLANKRTNGAAADFEERLGDSLNASVWDVIKSYFWESGYSKLLLTLILVAVFVVVMDMLIFRKDHRVQLALIALQLISVLSWLVLAKSHAYFHKHIDFVLFDLGLTQTCLYCILKAFSDHICLGMNKEIKQDKASYSIIFRLMK